MKISKHCVVSMVFNLHENAKDGRLIESIDTDNPFIFLCGEGILLPNFEKALYGLKTGDDFQISLKADDAYGQPNPDAIQQVPIEVFKKEGEKADDYLKLGQRLFMEDPHGQVFEAEVLEIKDDLVTMDFNHALAGEDLYFEGKILSVRKATKEEIDHHHVHGEHGHQH